MPAVENCTHARPVRQHYGMGPGSRSLRFLGRDDVMGRWPPARPAWINRAAVSAQPLGPTADCRLPTAAPIPAPATSPYHPPQQLRGKRMATDHPGQGPVPGGRARWRGWVVRTTRERPGSMGGRVFAVDWGEPGAGNGSTNGTSGVNAGGSPSREHSGQTPDGRPEGRKNTNR